MEKILSDLESGNTTYQAAAKKLIASDSRFTHPGRLIRHMDDLQELVDAQGDILRAHNSTIGSISATTGEVTQNIYDVAARLLNIFKKESEKSSEERIEPILMLNSALRAHSTIQGDHLFLPFRAFAKDQLVRTAATTYAVGSAIKDSFTMRYAQSRLDETLKDVSRTQGYDRYKQLKAVAEAGKAGRHVALPTETIHFSFLASALHKEAGQQIEDAKQSYINTLAPAKMACSI